MGLELMNNIKPSKENMLKMANEGFTTATDFADYLVTKKNLTFRDSYGISSTLVNFAEKNKITLDKVTIKDLNKIYKNLDKDVLKVFNVKNSMNAKNSYGGTSAKNVKKMIKKYKKENK